MGTAHPNLDSGPQPVGPARCDSDGAGPRTCEVAIVGGGPAGLSAALVFARARRRVALFESGTPRNAASPGVFGFLSRDGIAPEDLRAVARTEIERYGGVTFHDARVTGVTPFGDDAGFDVFTDAGDRVHAALVLLAAGKIDMHPVLEGFERLWGRRVINCAFCHGWENRDRPWGVLARRLDDVAAAVTSTAWTDRVTVFAEPGLRIPDEKRHYLDRLGIVIEQERVTRLIMADDDNLVAVELSDSRRVECGTLLVSPEQRQTALVRSLGLELDESGAVKVDEAHETSVPGIHAAGDLSAGRQDVISAAAAGSAAAKKMTSVLAQRAVRVSR